MSHLDMYLCNTHVARVITYVYECLQNYVSNSTIENLGKIDLIPAYLSTEYPVIDTGGLSGCIRSILNGKLHIFFI